MDRNLKNLKAVIIHSTVKPGTTKIIQEKSEIPVLFSPVRGVHRRFLDDVKNIQNLLHQMIMKLILN